MTQGPDWTNAGRMWLPDTTTLDEHFLSSIDIALDNLGTAIELVRWHEAQADRNIVERWWGKQRPRIKAEVLNRMADGALAVTLGHGRTLDDDGHVWMVRTVVVRRTRPRAVEAAS